MNPLWERGTRAESYLFNLPAPFEPAMVFRFNDGPYVLRFQGHPIGLAEAKNMQEAIAEAENVLIQELTSYQVTAVQVIQSLTKDSEEHKEQNTYWESHGKYQEQANQLSDMMPDFSYTDNPYLNLFIAMSHLYYDAYNNGGGNIEDCYQKDFEKYVLPMMPEMSIDDFIDCHWEHMEEAMDKTIEFLQGKDMQHTSYPVWWNCDEEEISYTEKTGDGWKAVLFGKEADLNQWVKVHRSFGFHLVQ